MTPTTAFDRPPRYPSRRRRVVRAASIALVAGLVGSAIALGVDHATGLSAFTGASSSN
jgi:hypothetical protein